MNLEQLNVMELSSEELVETTGGCEAPMPLSVWALDPDQWYMMGINPITDCDVNRELGW